MNIKSIIKKAVYGLAIVAVVAGIAAAALAGGTWTLFAIVWFTICLTVAAFVIWPSRWQDQVPPLTFGVILRFGNPPKDRKGTIQSKEIRRPGFVHLWPWEELEAYDDIDVEIDIPEIPVPMGAGQPQMGSVDVRAIVHMRGAAVIGAPNRDPLPATRNQLFGAVVNVMSGIRIEAVTDLQKSQIARIVKAQFQKAVSLWDVEVLAVSIEEVRPPKAVQQKWETITIAEGEATASEKLSIQEALNKAREIKAQGVFYPLTEAMGGIVEAARGGLKALGLGGDFVEALTGYVAADVADRQEREEAEA